MNLKKIKDIKNHTLYIDTESLQLVLAKEYELEYKPLLEKIAAIQVDVNIPKIYSIEHLSDMILSYEEYIEGHTLDEQFQNHSFINSDQLFNYLYDIINSLIQLHAAGIIHKDIKPQNIIIKQSSAYLIDYNISRIYDQTKSKDTHLIGTEGYASPEQYGFTQTTVKSDIYSLGKTIDEMLGYAVIEPKMFKQLKQLTAQMTTLEPAKRPAVGEVLTSLNKIRNGKKEEKQPKQDVTPKMFWGYVETYHGPVINFITAIFLLMYTNEYNYVSTAHKFKSYPYILILVTYYITVTIFNMYLHAFSYPRLRNYKPSQKIRKSLKWWWASTVDIIVFALISSFVFEVLYLIFY